MRFLVRLAAIVSLGFSSVYLLGYFSGNKPLHYEDNVGSFVPYDSYVKDGETPKQLREEVLSSYPDYFDPHVAYWEEFLEECESAGVSPWDPDGEEIYDLFYGN